jgi:rubredoxin
LLFEGRARNLPFPKNPHCSKKAVNAGGNTNMRKYECIVCGYIYDEALGWPDDGIPAGTKWEDVPADWVCPDCGVSKEDFELIQD